MLKSTIIDTRVRLRPSQKVLKFLDAQKEHFEEVPANVATILKKNGYKLLSNTKILKDNELSIKRPVIDTKLLDKLTAEIKDLPDQSDDAEESNQEEDEDAQEPQPAEGSFLYLIDLHWLNDVLTKLRSNNKTNTFLHELIESCELILPENELKPRNPELEARCQRLREEQQNREYQKMTKNVDATLKHHPEDTIAYQCKLFWLGFHLNSKPFPFLMFFFSKKHQ